MELWKLTKNQDSSGCIKEQTVLRYPMILLVKKTETSQFSLVSENYLFNYITFDYYYITLHYINYILLHFKSKKTAKSVFSGRNHVKVSFQGEINK